MDHNFYSPGGTSEPICIKSSTFYFKSMDMLYKAKLYVKRMKEIERVPLRKNPYSWPILHCNRNKFPKKPKS